MRASIVVKADPVTDGADRVLDAVESLAMDARLFQSADDAFHHAVLLRALRRDELLLQKVVGDLRRRAARREDQAVVGPEQETLA